MNLTAEEFVNDYLVDRNLIGRTRAAKVASLLDAWIRQEFTGPHSRQVEGLRRHNADLRAALEATLNWLEHARISGALRRANGYESIIEQARAALAAAGGEEAK